MPWHPSPSPRPIDPIWTPLLHLARTARREDTGWAVDVADFAVLGEIRRRGKPTVVVYQHTRTSGVVGVDETGHAARISVDAAGRVRVKDITARAAVFLAGIPSVDDPVGHLGPVYDEPRWDEPLPPLPPRPSPGRPRRRRRVGLRPGADRSHLRVV